MRQDLVVMLWRIAKIEDNTRSCSEMRHLGVDVHQCCARGVDIVDSIVQVCDRSVRWVFEDAVVDASCRDIELVLVAEQAKLEHRPWSPSTESLKGAKGSPLR